MAFIDWLRKQHEESARNKALFEGRPRVAASQAWGGYRDPNPQSRLMVRQPSPTSVTLTEKDDGSTQKVTKWEPDKQEKRLKATALPPGPAVGEPTPLRAKPSFGGLPLDLSRWGGQRGQIENLVSPGMMSSDPSWAGVPRARAAPQPRRVQPRVSDPMNTRPGTVGGSLQHPASIANIGMPRVADLRNRVREIDRQQAAIPRQQMPPPRFVPRVDPSQFPTISPGQIAGATSDAGDPRVQMSGGFDWTGQALRENVGEDLRNVWNPISDRVKQMLEQIRKRREGQTMAPFDRGWY